MIKILLVIYTLSANGPATTEIAEFRSKDLHNCKAVGELIVQNLEASGEFASVTYRCRPFTEV